LTALLDAQDDKKEEPANHASETLEAPDRALASAQDLLSADAERVRRGLANLTARGPEVACAILLLAHRDLQDHVRRALTDIATTIPGQLLDALLDPAMDFAVRRRIPRILRRCSTQRVAEGLLLAINDERFEVRYECGRALLAVTEGNSQIVISEERTLEAIRREVSEGEQLLENLARDFDDGGSAEEQSSLLQGLVRDRVDRSLEHVFTILSLHLDREPLRLAFRALHHEDTRHRGTALEYLDTVLPPEIHDLVWPRLGAEMPLPSARGAHELLAELANEE